MAMDIIRLNDELLFEYGLHTQRLFPRPGAFEVSETKPFSPALLPTGVPGRDDTTGDR